MNNNNNVSGRKHPSLDDRQAAERKLCRLFQSLGVDALALRDRLIDPFINRAMLFWRSHGGLDLATLAQDEAEADLQTWFAAVLGLDDAGDRASLMTGRAAFLMCGGPKCSADMLLRPVDELPVDFLDTMRDHAPVAVPPGEDGDMHHQPYEAWSIRHVVAKATPIDKGMLQGLSSLIRRDGRSLGLGWRDTRSTS